MARSSWALLLTLGLLAAMPAGLLACLWDYDTLKQERSRFPDALELITGKFLRHSREFYKWRIADRKARLEKEPDTLALYDDLAVAYDKVGEHQKAIDTILAKEKSSPGLYQTEANLGTFYIHAGQPEKGLPHIERALQINLDAHFGREKYQKLLVEYVMQRRKVKGKQLPLSIAVGSLEKDAEGNNGVSVELSFNQFLWPQETRATVTAAERDAAIKGMLGIMRFGSHDSPVVLEALGSLLLFQSGAAREDAKRLAARAFLRASYEAKDEEAKRGYRALARNARSMQTRHPQTQTVLSLEELENDFQQELTEARQWYAEVHENEQRWIKEGKNADEEFERTYYTEPAVSSEPDGTEEKSPWWTQPVVRVAAGVIGMVLVLAVVVGFLGRSSRSRGPLLPD